MITVIVVAAVAGVAAVLVLTLPWWLPARVVALRVRVFARINGEAAISVPGDLVGVERFMELYSHPAAGGRSKGATLSDLFWYWLSPGPHVHQEHLEAGERYDAVARATRGFLHLSRADAEELTRRCVTRETAFLAEKQRTVMVRVRDLMMPVWAAFYHELVFGEPCPPDARDLIVGNANDVVTSLKCTGLRHMKRRHRLTRYLEGRLDDVRSPLPDGLSRAERAFYLQGTFFNTAVVQMSEAMAHLLMVFAQHQDVQARVAVQDDDQYLDQVIAETLRLYPLFGIAHRITTGDIELDGGTTTIPAGSVVCFNYPDFHRAGYDAPARFDPGRWLDRSAARQANHIPFGVAANRPCPAWRLAPITMRVAAREILRRHTLTTSAAHTRSLPNRGPCLLTPRAAGRRPGRTRLAVIRLRDRWSDVWRSIAQLVLGTYMVWDARRARPCERHFSEEAEESRALSCPGRGQRQ